MSEQDENPQAGEQGSVPAAGGDVAPAEACQYPGCTRPVPRAPGRGRPARYCGEVVLGTVHNRANALTRRTQLARVGVDPVRAVSEPVTVARATAVDLVGRLELAVREQGELQARLVEALRTMDSPEQAAAQAAAATETARAQAATARADAAAAATRAEQAEAERDQAIADAQDADAEAVAARQDAAAAAAETATAREALAGEQAAHAHTRTELAAQTIRAEHAEAENERLAGDLRARTDQRDQALAAVDDLRDQLAQARADAATAAVAAAEREAALVRQAAQLGADLTTARTQVDQLHTDLRAADAATAQATARADRAETEATRLTQALAGEQTAHADTRAQVDKLRDQLAQTRTDAAAAAARADAELTAARAQLEQAHTELVAARSEASTAAARAATAEAQLAEVRRPRK